MNFDQISLRLKQQLGVTTDKEMAEALGMSKTAFAERKRRGVFPAENVAVLAGKNKNIDVEYVLTGASSKARGNLAQAIEQVNEYVRAISYEYKVSEPSVHYGESPESERIAKLVKSLASLDEKSLAVVESLVDVLISKK